MTKIIFPIIFILCFLSPIPKNIAANKLNPNNWQRPLCAPDHSNTQKTADKKDYSCPINPLSTQWFESEDPENLKAVALVIHGLNFKPNKMESIISQLTDAGIDVLNLSLYGHGNNYNHSTHTNTAIARLKSFKKVTYSKWENETRQAYYQLKEHSEQKNVPMVFIGYSFGSLMGLNLILSNPDVGFDKMVLFAPALDIHAKAHFLKILSFFPGIVIPSLSPKIYRANRGTPVAGYNAMFKAIKRFDKKKCSKLNIPAVIFIDPHDELVSYKGLKKIKQNNNFDQWEFFPVKKVVIDKKNNRHHLLINEASTGKNMWIKIMDITIAHLGSQQF